jgi:hypothetical protein
MLAEAVELIAYGASCNRCHETRRVDLARLRDRFGPQLLVGEIRPRLRCSKWGNRRIISVTLWLSASSTSSMSAHHSSRSIASGSLPIELEMNLRGSGLLSRKRQNRLPSSIRHFGRSRMIEISMASR